MERPEGHARDTSKTYWWIKLYEGFFYTKEMKKLRRIAGGAVYTLIYLKMQQIAMKSCGKLYFDGIEDTFAEEIALTIDESPEDVSATLVLLEKMGLAKKVSDDEIYLPEVEQNTGSETKWAGKKREYRRAVAEKKAAAIEVSEDNVLDVSAMCPTDIEIEKEIDIDKRESKKRKRFTPPTLEEVQDYCRERDNNVDANRFIDYYTSNGWLVGKNKMKDWKAAVRTWERNNYSDTKPKTNNKVADELDNFYDMAKEWAENGEEK